MLTRIRRRLEHDDGISLVEVLAAMFVLAIVLTASASGIITSLQAIASDELRVTAVQVANDEIEAVRALPWELVGFLDEDVDDPADYEYEGRAPVILDGSELTAEQKARVPVPGARESTRGGERFTVELFITWAGSDDADPDSEDYKRTVAVVTWTDRTRAQTLVSENLRSPTAEELGLIEEDEVEFELLEYHVNPLSQTLNEEGKTSQEIVITARVSLPATVARLYYVRTTTGELIGPMTGTANDDNTIWTWTIAQGTGDFQAGTASTFTVELLDGAGNTVTGDKDVMFFDPDVEEVEIDLPTVSPALCVRQQGNDRTTWRESVITVAIRNAFETDPVRFSWTEEAGSDTGTFIEFDDEGKAVFEGRIPAGHRFDKRETLLTVSVEPDDPGRIAERSDSFDVTRTNTEGACP